MSYDGSPNRGWRPGPELIPLIALVVVVLAALLKHWSN